ncbi:uncharacterized protein C1orf131 homolog [Bombus pascuorum]|uniref:uncharacterized protein C1orf131 homolog n=1 Tax=Bombus pascuorum TaxID=65598 RepID=UPI00298E09C5|nr:uncharacterized protein C1orf131 homolog [Bombus pascuorum]XP_060812296.1 uncharacterized protein C1orf131 homolog [Bombus pascuorum]
MEDFIPTRVSKIKQDVVKEFVSVNYERPKKRVKTIESKENNDVENSKFNVTKNERNENDKKRKQELEMKRVRYEVMKFGMSGFKEKKAKEAEVALAISLGAKPPKRKAINYKILQRERKIQKKTRRDDVTHASGLKKSLSNHKNKKARSKRGSDGILNVYGKVSKKTLGKNQK